jgi:hypothetical protein
MALLPTPRSFIERFWGALVAPYATVKLSADVEGYLIGGYVVVEPDTTLTCNSALSAGIEILP